MGAWGLKSFENDDAGDWLIELGQQGADLIAETLNAVLDDGDPADDCYPEAPEAAEALAAAELVAAAKSGDPGNLPAEAQAALQKLGSDVASAENIVLAREAAERVKTRSELRVLWAETDELEDWTKDVDRLIALLS